MNFLFLIAVVLAVVSAFLATSVLQRKGYGGGWGIVLGLLLGPIGLLIALAVPPRDRR